MHLPYKIISRHYSTTIDDKKDIWEQYLEPSVSRYKEPIKPVLYNVYITKQNIDKRTLPLNGYISAKMIFDNLENHIQNQNSDKTIKIYNINIITNYEPAIKFAREVDKMTYDFVVLNLNTLAINSLENVVKNNKDAAVVKTILKHLQKGCDMLTKLTCESVPITDDKYITNKNIDNYIQAIFKSLCDRYQIPEDFLKFKINRMTIGHKDRERELQLFDVNDLYINCDLENIIRIGDNIRKKKKN